MDKIFTVIAGVAVLGALFVPSPYVNSYDVPESQLRHGVLVELIMKNKRHTPIIRNSKIVTNGKSLDLKILEDTHTVSNNRGKVYKQFYDKKSGKYVILGLKRQ